MTECERFAVYSDFREGYLIGFGPSLWHYDIDWQLARAAASRRRSGLVVVGQIIKVDAGLDFEPLAKIDLAPPGTRIVTITDSAAAGRLYHLVKSVRSLKMSMRCEGIQIERDAKKAVDAVNAAPDYHRRLLKC